VSLCEGDKEKKLMTSKTKKRIIRFVVDEALDIDNHLIRLWTYQNGVRALNPKEIERCKKLLPLSPVARRRFMRKELKRQHSPKMKKFSAVIAEHMNEAWAKIEREFVRRIEEIHKRPFTFRAIRGVLSSADRFGYNLKDRWFAVSMYRNEFAGTDTAMHELMHFMFHVHYQATCEAQGLTEKQIWDIKESFTVLLNVEFDDLRFNRDAGYPEHQELRAVIKRSWLRHHDFEKTLARAIVFVKKK
jgi:hypothetical protein